MTERGLFGGHGCSLVVGKSLGVGFALLCDAHLTVKEAAKLSSRQALPWSLPTGAVGEL